MNAKILRILFLIAAANLLALEGKVPFTDQEPTPPNDSYAVILGAGASLKGAQVTDFHPSEKGADNFLTPANAKQHHRDDGKRGTGWSLS